MRKLLSMAVFALLFVFQAHTQIDISLNAKVYLKSALIGSFDTKPDGTPLMRDDLRDHPETGENYIPFQDPYSVPTAYTGFITDFYTHVGGGDDFENTSIPNPGFVFGLTGSDAVVDWVFVELRSKFNPTQVVSTRSGLLQRDGDIVDLDGETSLVFSDVIEDSYYVAVRHRSHLDVLSADIYTPSQMTEGIDFTDPNTAIYDMGTSMSGRNYTNMATDFFTSGNNNYRSLWAGDYNADGKIKYVMPMSDLNNLYKDIIMHDGNTNNEANYDGAYGYFQTDGDMNGQIKYNSPGDDTNVLFQAIQLYPLNGNGDENFDFFIAQIPN